MRADLFAFPTSFTQQRLWFLDQLQSRSSFYNVFKLFSFEARLNEQALESALNEIVRRHESLRTTFPSIDGRPYQLVSSHLHLSLRVFDLRSLPRGEQQQEKSRVTNDEASAPFDLAHGPLLRASLVRLSNAESTLLITMHHIITDGWSMELFSKELSTLYDAYRTNRPSPLPELPLQYADFAVWQRKWLDGDVSREQLAYWKTKLAGAPAVIDLPWDRRRPAVQSFEGGNQSFALSENVSRDVLAFSRAEGVTIFTTLLAAFQVLLARLSHSRDIVVGTPLAGRTHTELEGLIGFFVNTLALRTDVSGNPTWREMVHRTESTAMEAYANQDLPFDRIVAELAPDRTLAHSPVVQVMFALQSFLGDAIEPESEWSGDDHDEEFSGNEGDVDPGTAKFDLTMTMFASDDILAGQIEYSRDLIDPETAERWALLYTRVLEALAANPDGRVEDVPLLDAEERRIAIEDWNQTDTAYPRNATLAELFAEQANANPDALAIAYGDATLTYRELDDRSRQLAQRLLAAGVAVGDRVGVCLERSPDLIAAILAVVRAGAAYVPLDAKYPASRIRLIAEDAAVRLLVTAESFETLPPASEAPLPKTSADSIAYVMYTSGSTGLPKGVAVPQRAITRLVRNTNYIDITPADRIGQASNIAFDAATFEIWGALLNGAAIVGIDRDTALTPRNYAAALRRESISLLFVTTGLFNQIAREVPDAFRTVRQVMVGGETVDPEFMGIVLKAGRPGRLLNAYGPTETTTFATTFEIESVNGDEPIPIGRPIGNTQTYVLDEHLEPQPVGVIGELYIGGDGVAAGYFNAPELTAQKFIDDPFRPGQRLYRTGDRARYRADGAIEFLGRRDTQVKIRGFRVETGEIESVLVAHPAVREAAVQTSGGKGTPQQLNGYVVWNEGTHFPMTDLRLWVGSQLPDYMVPGRWIELESLPLNANGKVDRHALPAPDSDRPDLEVTYTAPRNATEHQISAIWSQLTGIEKIGVEDNFFEIGGHSLLATQVVSRLRDRLGVDMPVRVIFERPTVAGLAEWVSEGKLARSDWSMRQIARRTTPGPAPLSFSQQRLWFLDQLDPDSILYNINDVVHYAGELNVSALENALSELHRRHETLRTTFASLDGIAVQFVGPPAHVTLPVTDLSSMRRAEAEAEYAKLAERHGSRPYDLAKGPLFRVRLIKVGNGDHRLLIGMHHIISDGWSLGVLHRELETLYAAYAAGKAPEREELPIQYADFAVWQRNRLQGEVLAELREWWLAHLAGAPPVINLPTDRPRPAVQTFQGETQTKSLTPSLARTLTELGQRAGATLFMTLLAAWYVLLHRFSGEEEIVVGTPIAGRTHSELEPLIGFFVNTLVIRASITGNPTFREVLRQVRDAANGAYAHQDLPFERLVAELAPERRLSHTPLFQCFFALQNDRAHNETHGEIETVPSTSMFDLSLTMLEHGGTLAASFEYSTELFDTPTITRLMGHLERLLEGIAADPDQPIFSYAILGEAERTRVIHEFNATAVPYPHATSVIALFEERVRQSPDAIAVRFEDRELTYAQLDASANNLATHLTRDTLVGLSMERSCEMIIALVGILKAGAAYVPLDPNYPKHRLAQIQSDANLSTIINDTNAPVWSAAATAAAFVCSEREAPGPLQPAYVIYTSGSTGQPKGVPIHHRALLNYVEAASEQYEITSRDRVLQFASINFDASIEEIWPTLTRGATLVLRTPMMVASVAEFLARCDEWRVTVVSLPTAFWHEVVDRIVADRLTIPPRLRLVIIGGDRALPDRVSQWQRHVKHVRNVRLMNTYGPTEATVVATIYPVGRKALPAGEVPIGKPIRNTRVYILDAHGQPVPIGVRGELCIAGDGLSLGYLHRPELTAQKFFDDPFIENQRVYRSGDLARWKSDGNLEFCGRVDRQVKVRGFRIELDEIETILNDHEAVKDSVVVTHEHPPGNKRLIAYIVPDLSHRSDDSAKPQKVGEWEAVFDDLYAEVDPQQAASFYIKGWDSSYTGEPMPADEVETWMNQTVERITSLHPKRIREIGSGGSGLMLFRLAPFCDSYTGTDLSDKALAVLQHQLDSREPIPGVSLVHCPAHAQNLAPDSVDAVLIVSVAQYFPNIDYLLEVLERAIEGIAPGGFLFLGDIRNHSLLDAFHASVQLFQAEPSLSVSELNRRIRKHHAREKQLTVDPAFFHALLTRIPKITAVETRLLRGRNRNELTRFRYDAILHVGTPAVSPSVEWQPWPHLSSRALSEGPGREGHATHASSPTHPGPSLNARDDIGWLRNLLQANPTTLHAFANVPNARVQHDVAATRILTTEDAPSTVGELHALLDTNNAVDPEDLWQLADDLGMSADITWPGFSTDGSFDVVFRPNGDRTPIPPRTASAPVRPWHEYANDPSAKISIRKLAPELRTFVAEHLPDYMVPAQFVVLESLPLTAAGKVDRRALPPPDHTRADLDDSFAMPRTAIEATLASIWAEVLDVDRVGIKDNFFELGGDSILSIQIIARANEAGLRFTPKQLFQHQTIAELAAVAGSAAITPMEQGEVTGNVPLTPIQQWFFDVNLPHAQAFTQSAMFDLDETADRALAERILAELQNAHDAFRLRYVRESDGWRQFYTESAGRIPLTEVDLSKLPEHEHEQAIEATAQELQQGLNLASGPIARAALFHPGPGQQRHLLLFAHHLVVDGVSWRILQRDVQTLLEQLRQSNDQPVQLPLRTTSFKHWAERLREFAQSDEAKHALDFWSPLLDTEIPALPLDHHDDEGPTSAGVVLVTLSADETRNVLQEVPKAYRTQINDVLLTALAQAFCEWSGESKLLLDMEGHGREPIFDDIDLSRTVGWFTSVYPVLLDLTGSIGPGEALRTVKEQLRRVPGRGMSFGVLKYLSDDPSIVARMHDLPNAQICFNYLGQANAVRMAADPAASPSVELTEVSITDQTGEGEWGAASHLLDINGAVNNGRLQLSWAFSTKFHRAETIKAVAEKFASALRLLIAHCKSSEARGYSPSDFPLARLDQDKLAWLAGTDRQIEDIYPLSPMQEGMLFHSLYDPDSGEYIEQALFPLPGNLDIALFRKAWDQLAERHSILRTSFVWSGLDSPLQIVRRKVELPWEVRDASIEEMQRYLDADGTRGFDLSRAPLMRFAIFRISDDEIQFLWTSHHILLDGWSHPKVLAELHALYDALVDGSDPQLEPVRPYRHYIEWLEQQDLSKAEVFWRETLKGFTTPTPLVIAGPTVEAEKDYFEQYLELSAEKSAAIERVARESAVTANTVAQAGWALLLSRYSGENDVLFGAVVAGRPTALTGVERMVGLFINTLPVRVRINPAGTVSLWLKDLQRQQIDAREFEHTPLSQVQGWSDVRRGSSLFDSLFVFENYPDIPSFTSDDDAPETEGVPSEPTVPMERTNYLLTVAVVPGSRWILRLTYESTRIPHDAIRRLLGHYRTILTSIARQPEQPTRSIPLLSASERHELLHAWNATERTEPPLVLAHQAFEQQAALTPRAIAVDFDPEHLTYAELNSKANQLAREILTSETLRLCDSATRIVAIALERSIDSAIALLATLKAGCAYVPLDPTYPADRLAFMLEDSGASLLLTHRNLTGPTGSQPVIYLDDRTTQLPSHNLDLTIDADSPAYVIYTSGSTGKPKGIVMPHGPLANLIRWQTTTSTPRPKPRTLQFAPLSFDVHFQEMFATWAAGGTVVLITEQLRRDTPALVAHLCERRVDRLFLPFVALQQLAEAVDGTLPPLREVITAGEQLQCTPSITSLFERLKKASLHNHYGPSESHVVTAHRLDGRPRDWPALPPIGKPIDNARIHILDDRGHPVPVGVPGHLHIGGDVLAHGYRNLPDVTAERFISDPFVEDETARLYATGDLARYLPDGAIEFLGRSDFQVKIRGFRIEPGEIEVILSQHPAVQHCVVTSWEDAPGDKRLVGYIVPHHQPGPGAADLRKFLETRLPEYMLPSAFVTLASLPMTASGKVDRKALPAPDRLRPVLERPFEAPRDPVEERLAAIYADVLHVDRIGIHDNFFELGGHSLLATRILSRIRDVFQVQLSLRTVFETPTVAAIAAQVVKAGSASLRERKIPRRREAGTCPLSFAQQRLWFLDQLQPNTSLYNVSRTFPFAGTVDPRNLESALNGIVRRHEVLRTTFVAVAGRPFQLIAAMLQIPLPTHDLRRMRAAKRDEERARITAKVVDTPFDLSRGPLLRAALIRLSATESELVVAMHHIITDGWSMDVFARELLHPISSLDELPVQYADYAVWQRQWVDDDVSAVELAYWRKQLAGIPDTLDLPYDRPRPAAQSLDGAMLSFAFPKALSDAVRETARAKNVTPFTMLLAAFTALLSRLSNSTDIVIGTPVAGRSRTELENLIGLFVNTVVLRTNLDGNPTMDELLRRVEQTTLEAFDHQDLPFDRLVAELAPNRQLSYNPVVQVMFAVQSGTLQSDMLDTTSAKFDLICTMYESDEGLSGAFEFSTDLLDSETARRWATLYERTLTALVSEGTLSDFPLLTDSERDRALITWNDTASDYPHDATLIGLFAEQVAARPDHPAVIYGTRTLTYRELDALSTHLASTLDINPGDRIAIQMDRSPDLIASLIAILKRGATYVPLDTTYPQERIRHILEDSHAKIWSAVAAATAFPQRQPQLPHVPAYLMYTSGSTGNPKGVAIPQRAIIRLVRNTNYIDITPADRIAQSSSIAFDAATFEIWGALLNGATIVGFDRDTTLSATLYARALHDANVTTLFITTALFNQIAHEHPAAFAPIRNVLFGGEKADVHSVRAVLNAGKPQHLMNVYGPTETTTFATFHEITTLDENETSIPIGRAIGNTQVYILDRNLAPQPIGIPGEIYIGGDGLALEYLNAPDLTAARFVIPSGARDLGGRCERHDISCPTRPGPSLDARDDSTARLYKTGDLARYRADGAIDFIGRLDNQVKIRGFRVEPGEIEAALLAHPYLREVTVQFSSELIAYFVAEEGRRPNVSELREWLGERLPAYMIPAHWIELPSLPLNASGKIDRRALPAPGADRPELSVAYAEPRNDVESTLASIWQQLLKLDKVGRSDNFFELGGHSLLATQVVSRLRDAFGVEVPVRLLFERPTIAAMAEALSHGKSQPAATENIVRHESSGPCPLSFCQERLWFLDQLDPGTPLFNIHDVIHFAGAFDHDALEAALSEVVARHETLRTTFASVDGVPVQIVGTAEFVHIPITEVEDEYDVANWSDIESQEPFDLTTGPLFRARVIKLADDDHRLLLTLHHIVADGWSLAILRREIETLYTAPASLEELPVQYTDFSLWQRNRVNSGALSEQLEFWQRHLANLPPALELPLDRPRPLLESSLGARQTLQVPESVVAALRDLCKQKQVTTFMLMLAAFKLLIHRYTGQTDLLIGCPVAGRTRAEIENLIGFFLNTLALRTDVSGNPTFHELLDRIRETTLDTFANQDVPYEKLAQTKLFHLFFNVINFDVAGAPTEESSEPTPSRSIFDLTLYVFDQPDGLLLEAVYRTDLYEASTIRRLLQHLETILETVAKTPELHLSRFALTPHPPSAPSPLAEGRRPSQHQPSPLVKGEKVPKADEGSIPQLFEETARRRARHIAIRSRHHTWTYAALQRRARIIATNLVTRGITPGDRVALLFEHDAPMLAAILGTLQAGGVYVPIDPTFPADRIKHIVSDADATLILADTINFETAIATKRPAINIDELSASDAQLPTITPDAHAYILYTSGSTGQPKGVLQNHRNVLHHIRTYTNALRIQPRDHLSLIAAYGFDAAVMDIFGALLNGATLHPIDVKSESPESLARLLDDNAITIYHSTATVYRYLLGNNPSHRFNTIRTVVLGGEEVFRRDFDLFRTHFSEHAIFINGLGPTESTLALQYVMDHETELPRNAVPVGYPVPGTEVLLLDDSGHPVEGCGTGELAFRARHLALGYWRRPQLTAQAFSTHNGDASLRTYRTGDLARLLPDGRFEFLGRKDRQLKMRGVRIELGEVEARLLEHDAIREALVHVFEPTTGDRRLAAYYVPRNGDTPAPADLRAFLRERLPDVMVPSAFVSLASLPLLPNGKIDRDSLPKPDLSRLESTATFVAPTTPVEMLVASIWSSLLRVPRISVTDNFFDLGGHSLLATQLAARVRSTFHVDLPLREIFKTPTLSALAALIDASSTPHVVATPSIAKTARENYRVTVTHTGDLILPHALTIAHASELPTASAAPMLAPPQPQQRTAALSP